MATLQQYYNTGDNSDIFGMSNAGYWVGQQFTPAEDFKIYSAKFKMFRTITPGTMNVQIKAVDGSGHPTGTVLASGSIDADTFGQSSPGAWHEITLSPTAELSNGIQYVVIVNAPDITTGDKVTFRGDTSSPTYTGGAMIDSLNDGSTWTVSATRDLMFEIWGTVFAPPAATDDNAIVTARRLVAAANGKFFYET